MNFLKYLVSADPMDTSISEPVSIHWRIFAVSSFPMPIAQRNSSKSIGPISTICTYPMGDGKSPSEGSTPGSDTDAIMSHLPSTANGFRAENARGQDCIPYMMNSGSPEEVSNLIPLYESFS